MYVQVANAKIEYRREMRRKQLRNRIGYVLFLLAGLLMIYIFHNIGTGDMGNAGAGNYSQLKDAHSEIDLSQEVKKGEIPLFLQWDERWGYENYGSDFMAVTGCGPTCLAMVYCGVTGKTDLNPYSIARKAENEGYYVKGAGSAWDMMTELAEELGLWAEEMVFDEEHIMNTLEEGSPIICIMGPGDFTTSGHFIVLTGVDSNGEILVNDPNSLSNSERSWKLEDLMSQIRNLWSYREA
ncbi:MAG: C39 family peptidase [Agathobacter sp.]|nr:C39 family peptidase [Agathobacter sp.]